MQATIKRGDQSLGAQRPYNLDRLGVSEPNEALASENPQAARVQAGRRRVGGQQSGSSLISRADFSLTIA